MWHSWLDQLVHNTPEYVRVRQLEKGSQGNEKVWLWKKICSFRIKSRVNVCTINFTKEGDDIHDTFYVYQHVFYGTPVLYY